MFAPRKIRSLRCFCCALALSLLAHQQTSAETHFYALSHTDRTILKKVPRSDMLQYVGDISGNSAVDWNTPHAIDPVRRLVFFTPTVSTIKTLDLSGPTPKFWPTISVGNLKIKHLEVDIAAGEIYFSAQTVANGFHSLHRISLLRPTIVQSISNWNLYHSPDFKISNQSRKIFAIRTGPPGVTNQVQVPHLIFASLNDPQLSQKYVTLNHFYLFESPTVHADFAGDDFYAAFSTGSIATNDAITKIYKGSSLGAKPFQGPGSLSRANTVVLTITNFRRSNDKIVNLAADTVDNKLYWYTAGTEAFDRAAYGLYELSLDTSAPQVERRIRGIYSYVGQPDYLVTLPLTTDRMQHHNRALPFDVNGDGRFDSLDFLPFNPYLGRAPFIPDPKTAPSSTFLDVDNNRILNFKDTNLLSEYYRSHYRIN